LCAAPAPLFVHSINRSIIYAAAPQVGAEHFDRLAGALAAFHPTNEAQHATIAGALCLPPVALWWMGGSWQVSAVLIAAHTRAGMLGAFRLNFGPEWPRAWDMVSDEDKETLSTTYPDVVG
jgi:hypothetical protein